MRTKKGLLLAAALFAAAPARAEWTMVTDSETSRYTAFFVDFSSLRVIGAFRRAWIMVDRSKPNAYGFLSLKVLTEFDCNEGRSRDLQMDNYKGSLGSGASLSSPTDLSWSYASPDSVGGQIMSAVCSYQPRPWWR